MYPGNPKRHETWRTRIVVDGSPLIESTGQDIACLRCPNRGASRILASRAKRGSAPGEVEQCHEGILQRTDRHRRRKVALARLV